MDDDDDDDDVMSRTNRAQAGTSQFMRRHVIT
jgi:hypothetical protein